jgi:DNA-binding GntR family transcriptional regulator
VSVDAPSRKRANVTQPGKLLSDIAYERILAGLFDRTVSAGAFLSQNDLVGLLRLPLAPLRDALRILETEGVVTIHPRSGIQFVKPDLELTRSTYQFRTIIERAAIRVFAETARESDIQAVLDRHLALGALVEKNGVTSTVIVELEAIERVFHGGIVEILNNPLILANNRRLENYMRLVRLDRNPTPPLVLRTVREHITVLEACIARDADRAEVALTSHLQSALQRNLGLF